MNVFLSQTAGLSWSHETSNEADEGKLKCKRELLLIQGWRCAEVHIVIPGCNIEGFHHLSLAVSRLIVCTFVSYWQRKTVCFPTILEFRGGALPYKRDGADRVKIRSLVPP